MVLMKLKVEIIENYTKRSFKIPTLIFLFIHIFQSLQKEDTTGLTDSPAQRLLFCKYSFHSIHSKNISWI